MARRPRPAFGILVGLLLIGTSACSQSGNPTAPASGIGAGSSGTANGHSAPNATPAMTAGAELHSQLAAVRAATAQYHNFDKAIADGFVQISPCVESPAGGMGYHYGLESRINDPAINYLEPEVLLYAPDKHGRLRLVAVEYIVPEPIWPGGAADPPNLFGLDFHAGPPPLLILHAWIWYHNPSGMFADFNPRVSCP